MKTQLTLASLLILASSFTHAASVYQCKDTNGKMTFSDMPCPENEKSEQVHISVPTPTTHLVPMPVNQTANISEESDYDKTRKRISYNLEVEKLERKISRQEGRIDSLYDEMDEQVRSLKKKKDRATNNFAGAQWETSISEEMQAITNQYHAKIDAENTKLSLYQAELTRFMQTNSAE